MLGRLDGQKKQVRKQLPRAKDPRLPKLFPVFALVAAPFRVRFLDLFF
jgi:hypothetical protein